METSSELDIELKPFSLLIKFNFILVCLIVVLSYHIFYSELGYYRLHVAFYGSLLAISITTRFVEAREERRLAARNSISLPPGHNWTRLFGFLPRKVFERFIGQTIADARDEYLEALASSDLKEAAKIARYLHWQVFKVVSLKLAELLFSAVAGVIKLLFGSGGNFKNK